MEIGSKVRFLHSTGEGEVIGFQGDRIVVLDEDGMETPYPASELVEVKMGAAYEKALVSTHADLNRKGPKPNTRRENVKTGGKGIQKLEVDLHGEKLCPNRAGMGGLDIHLKQLDAIRSTLDSNRHRHGLQITFIHGHGDGTLRQELITELRKRDWCSFEDASFSRYGVCGATKVTIR